MVDGGRSRPDRGKSCGDGGIGKAGGDDILRLLVSGRAGRPNSDYRRRPGAGGGRAGQRKTDRAPRKINRFSRDAILQKWRSSDSVPALTLNSSLLSGSGIL